MPIQSPSLAVTSPMTPMQMTLKNAVMFDLGFEPIIEIPAKLDHDLEHIYEDEYWYLLGNFTVPHYTMVPGWVIYATLWVYRSDKKIPGARTLWHNPYHFYAVVCSYCKATHDGTQTLKYLNKWDYFRREPLLDFLIPSRGH